MTITRRPDEIQISHVPFANWAARLLIILGLLVLLLWSTLGTPDPASGFLPHLLHSTGWLFAGAFLLFDLIHTFGKASGIFAPATSVRIDGTGKLIQITQTKFYRRDVSRHYFHQIDRFRSYRASNAGMTGYFLSLDLVNNLSLRFLIPLGTDKNATVKLIKELNKFVLRSAE